ncbi:hypothetical protein VTO73DRAFT_15109 [Trametes versicolor]
MAKVVARLIGTAKFGLKTPPSALVANTHSRELHQVFYTRPPLTASMSVHPLRHSQHHASFCTFVNPLAASHRNGSPNSDGYDTHFLSMCGARHNRFALAPLEDVPRIVHAQQVCIGEPDLLAVRGERGPELGAREEFVEHAFEELRKPVLAREEDDGYRVMVRVYGSGIGGQRG